LHGGNAGRPVTHGLYSKTYTQPLRDKVEAIRLHPELFNLYGELVTIKAMFGSIIEVLPEDTEEWFDDGFEIFEGKKTRVRPDNLAKLRVLIKLSDTVRKTYKTIVEAEERLRLVLTMNDVITMMKQMKTIIDGTCKECPMRSAIQDRLMAELRFRATPVRDAEFSEVTQEVASAEKKQKERKRKVGVQKRRAMRKDHRIGGKGDDLE